MNPNLRKVALIAASLGLLLSLYIALKPEPSGPGRATATAPTTIAATTTAVTPTVEASPNPIILNVDARTGEVARLTVEQGDRVVLNVTAAVVDHVHLHGYDLKADIGPGRPAKISFTADAPGRFELELEERGLEIAELEVRP